jgi:hypothetical protein
MKRRLLIFAVIALCAGLSSCQCADKPDIGPVEGEDEEAAVQSLPAVASASAVPLTSL